MVATRLTPETRPMNRERVNRLLQRDREIGNDLMVVGRLMFATKLMPTNPDKVRALIRERKAVRAELNAIYDLKAEWEA
jgi:hypothetical protein